MNCRGSVNLTPAGRSDSITLQSLALSEVDQSINQSFNMTNSPADTDTTGDYKKNHGKNSFPIRNDREKIFITAKKDTRGFRSLYSINPYTEDIV